MEIDRQALLRTFAAESAEQLAAMDEALAVLDRVPQDLEAARVLYRLVHTLEGSAATVELPVLTELAHGMKVAVVGVRDQRTAATGELRSALRAGVVSIRGSLARLDGGGEAARDPVLLARIATATAAATPAHK